MVVVKKRSERKTVVSHVWVCVAALAMPLMLSLVQGAMSMSMQSKHVQIMMAIIGAVVLLVASPRTVTAAAAQTQTQPGDSRKKACTLTGGELVSDGWGGKDTGGNSCNSCACDDGNVCATMPPQIDSFVSVHGLSLSLCVCALYFA